MRKREAAEDEETKTALIKTDLEVKIVRCGLPLSWAVMVWGEAPSSSELGKRDLDIRIQKMEEDKAVNMNKYQEESN